MALRLEAHPDIHVRRSIIRTLDNHRGKGQGIECLRSKLKRGTKTVRFQLDELGLGSLTLSLPTKIMKNILFNFASSFITNTQYCFNAT